jgi:WD40 repeat protein
VIREFPIDAFIIRSGSFSPDGRSLLVSTDTANPANADSPATMNLQLWDVATGKRRLSSPFPEFLPPLLGQGRSMASLDARFVLVAESEEAAVLLDAVTGKQIRSFEGHAHEVQHLAFSPDGRYLVTGNGDDFTKVGVRDNTTRIWDTSTGQQVRSLPGHSDTGDPIAFSPDSRLLLTGGSDKKAHLWDVATGHEIRSLTGHSEGVDAVAFSPNGRFALTGSYDKSAQLWDLSTAQSVMTFSPGSVVETVAISPDGHLVLTAGTQTDMDGPGYKTKVKVDTSAHLWDAATGQQLRSFQGHTYKVSAVAFSPDGRLVLTGSWDATARLWNTATGQQIRSFQGHANLINAVAFSPDGRFVLTGSADSTARLWDTASGQQIHVFEGHSGSVSAVAFSPDGRFVLTGSSDTTARLWDAATGKQIANLLSFGPLGWAVTDSEGRYDASDPDNTPGLVWVTANLDAIDLKDLKDDYYTPNLLTRILRGDRLPDVTGLDKIPAPPEVAIVSPWNPQTKSMTLTVKDTGSGVSKLVVAVNDRTVKVIDHPLAGRSGKNSQITVDLSRATLQPGENTASAYASPNGSNIRSHIATATFTVTANAKGVVAVDEPQASAEPAPQFYAIVIGTSSFANHSMDLQYPAHDADSMVTGLRIGADHLFGPDHVHLHLLTTAASKAEDQPTKKNIVAAFDDVQKNARPTDVLLVYLSGHGVNLRAEKDSYYYLTTDARSLEVQDNPALRDLSTVSSAELRRWLGAKNMPLKEVLILDTCAAGAANEELLKLVEKRDVPPDQRRAIEFLKEATGTVILMGSAADKSSYEASKYGQGLLTYALLEGMKGRAVEASSRLDVTHWFQFASEEVPELALSIGGIQKPQIAAPLGTGFPIALLDSTDQSRIPLAAIKPELLHLTCHDDNDEDPLSLAPSIRERLRAISYASARGAESGQPAIVYLDDIADGPADTLTPRIVYQPNGTTIHLRLRIVREGRTLAEESLDQSSSENDRAALAQTVANKLAAMAAELPEPKAVSPIP